MKYLRIKFLSLLIAVVIMAFCFYGCSDGDAINTPDTQSMLYTATGTLERSSSQTDISDGSLTINTTTDRLQATFYSSDGSPVLALGIDIDPSYVTGDVISFTGGNITNFGEEGDVVTGGSLILNGLDKPINLTLDTADGENLTLKVKLDSYATDVALGEQKITSGEFRIPESSATTYQIDGDKSAVTKHTGTTDGEIAGNFVPQSDPNKIAVLDATYHAKLSDLHKLYLCKIDSTDSVTFDGATYEFSDSCSGDSYIPCEIKGLIHAYLSSVDGTIPVTSGEKLYLKATFSKP